MTGQAASAQADDFPARLICILGMHRSGTSFLAGSLQQAGVALGDAHTWNPHNRKGNRENQMFVDLHDSILEANNGAWDRPPGRVVWREEHFEQARELLRHHAGEPVFGFKDPRALLAIDGWKIVYPQAEFIGIFRHPNSVATSLARRDGTPRWAGLALWYRYNCSLWEQYRKKPFPILCFDDSEAVLDEKLGRVAAELGLKREVDEDKFFSSDLKSSTDLSRPRLPWKVGRLYQRLKKVSL